MTKKTRKPTNKAVELIEVLRGHGHTPKPYSGRGMYGERCVAIHGEDIDVFALGRDLAEMDVRSPSADSLGRGQVYYWPKCSWPATEPEPKE